MKHGVQAKTSVPGTDLVHNTQFIEEVATLNMGRNNEGYPDPTAAAAIGEVAKAERSARANRSRLSGQYFEGMITASLNWYRDMGVAYIEKTPEPMKPLRAPNRQGQFLACFTKQGQPDFKGTLTGGRSVVFEAKHTDDDKIEYGRLTHEQIEARSCCLRSGQHQAGELLPHPMDYMARHEADIWPQAHQAGRA